MMLKLEIASITAKISTNTAKKLCVKITLSHITHVSYNLPHFIILVYRPIVQNNSPLVSLVSKLRGHIEENLTSNRPSSFKNSRLDKLLHMCLVTYVSTVIHSQLVGP